jgi:hypothetical protein
VARCGWRLRYLSECEAGGLIDHACELITQGWHTTTLDDLSSVAYH